MTVTLAPAPATAQRLISRMVADYLDELGLEAPIARSSVPLYWVEPGRTPFLIHENSALVGFSLVRHLAPGSFELAEFSILPGMRNRGLGQQAAALTFARFPGAWRLKAVPTARRFWPRTILAAGAEPSPMDAEGWITFDTTPT